MDRRSFGPVLTLVAVLPLAVAAGARSDLSESADKIAFSRNCSIFVINEDGSGQKRLTRPNAGCDGSVAWSPDGSRLAFVRQYEEPNAPATQPVPGEIYMMNADGSNARRIARRIADVGDPQWSPDGRELAFNERFGGAGIVNADGTEQRVLAPRLSFPADPSWSPRDDRLAVASNWLVGSRLHGAIYTVARSGGALRPVTVAREGQYRSPAWQPHGRKLLFTRQFCHLNGFCGAEIRVVDTGGSGGRRLARVPDPAAGLETVWSPDGARFLISHGRPGIWAMRADGSHSRRLTRKWGDGGPSWSPDGRRFAFGRADFNYGGSRAAIYVMNSDGGGLHKLVLGSGPSWQPRR